MVEDVVCRKYVLFPSPRLATNDRRKNSRCDGRALGSIFICYAHDWAFG